MSRDPAIDESVAPPSIDDAGRAHGAGRTEDHPVASGKPTSTVVDLVPGGYAGGGGASIHAPDGGACPVWGTAALVTSFERSLASSRVDHDT